MKINHQNGTFHTDAIKEHLIPKDGFVYATEADVLNIAQEWRENNPKQVQNSFQIWKV